MTCSDAKTLLPAYVDRELTGRDRDAVDRHIADCGICAAQTRLLGRFKAAVRAHLPRPPVPRAFEAQLRLALDEAKPLSRVASLWHGLGAYPRLFPALAAAALLLVILGSVRQQQSFVVEQARRTYQAAMPMDVLGDCPRVASWFSGRVDFPFSAPIKDKSACQGGRLVNVHDRLGAYVVFQAPEGHRVGLLVFDPSGDEDLVPRVLNRRMVDGQEIYSGTRPGVSISAIQRQGLDYVLTSDLDEEALAKFMLATFQH